MITAALLRSWGACWTDDEIANFAAGCTSMSPREIATHRDITIEDRLWVLCHALEHRNPGAAARVSHLAGGERDQAEHARLVADLRRIFALPVADHERELVAWNTAWYAARADAWDAARAGTWDAARIDAWEAAWEVARDAARAGTWDDAWVAAWVAAWDDAWVAAWDDALGNAVSAALTALGADADGWCT